MAGSHTCIVDDATRLGQLRDLRLGQERASAGQQAVALLLHLRIKEHSTLLFIYNYFTVKLWGLLLSDQKLVRNSLLLIIEFTRENFKMIF